MSETHAPFWVYDSGMVTLRFAPSKLRGSFTVDEHPQQGPTLKLGRKGWHVITVEVPHLVVGPMGTKVGLKLISLAHRPPTNP
jgi:hypothetical protein